MSKSYLHCLALPFLFSVVTFAQQSPASALSPHPDPPSVLAAANGEGRMKLDVVVTDKQGKPVPGLGLSDFTLLDNDQPSKIVSFHAVDGSLQKADPPVEVILLIDATNLGFQGVADVCVQLERFLRQNGGHLAQPVSLYVLTDQGLSVQPVPSVDGNALATEAGNIEDRLRTIGSRTGNNDAVTRFQFSLQMLTAIAEKEMKKPGRKLLIWIGPGWPMFDSNRPPVPSKAQLQTFFNMIVQLSTQLREAHISVYNVLQRTVYGLSSGSGFGISQGTGLVNSAYEDFLKGVRTPEEANTANLALKVLAIQSGGRALAPDNDLAGQIDRCIQDASAYYTLSFDPPRATGANEYHDLKLLVDKPKLKARTNTGYYNQLEAEPSTAQLHPEPAPKAAAPSALEAKPVTVAQLEQALKDVHDRPDAEAAKQLSGLVLTERLSSTKLLAWKASLPGAKAQQALVTLADASVFLAPPAAEIPVEAPPDLAAQRRIMALTIDYLGKILPKLPDFFATRITTHYREIPQKARANTLSSHPLHLEDTASATVLYRDGHEVVDQEAANSKKSNTQASSLMTRGTFGPILSVVIQDAANGRLKWSRWEQSADGPQAVFHFAVPREKSHYVAWWISSFLKGESDQLQQSIGYHGEIAIDPATGTILRLVLEANPDAGSLLLRSDIMVEYGPVEIGGKTHICPVRSVSISRGPSFQRFGLGGKETLGPAITMLNDVAFVDYHQFRAESRVLIGDDPAPERK